MEVIRVRTKKGLNVLTIQCWHCHIVGHVTIRQRRRGSHWFSLYRCQACDARYQHRIDVTDISARAVVENQY